MHEGVAKIGDFGLSKKFSGEDVLFNVSCGTPSYEAPEILNGEEYNYKVDICI
jgi:serine/threonine protein kinase